MGLAEEIAADPRSFVADMDATTLMPSAERCLVRAPLGDAIRSPSGAASMGALTTLVDVVASFPALAGCRPDWTATQGLSLHGAGRITRGPVFGDARLLRLGSRSVVVTCDFYDGCGAEDFAEVQAAIDRGAQGGAPPLAAKSLVTFARIPGSAAGDADDYDPRQWIGQTRKSGVAHPGPGRLRDWIGLETLDARAGSVEVEYRRYVTNMIGTVNGGAQSVLIETAAEAMCPGRIATDVEIHFLSQRRGGSMRSSGSVSRVARDHSVVTVELRDPTAPEQLLTLATVTLQDPGSAG